MIRSTPTPGAFTVIEKKKTKKKTNASREGKKEMQAKSTNVRFNVTVYLYALMACIINMTTTERNIRW